MISLEDADQTGDIEWYNVVHGNHDEVTLEGWPQGIRMLWGGTNGKTFLFNKLKKKQLLIIEEAIVTKKELEFKKK